MKKSYYMFLSALLFLIIGPFFNGLLTYLFFNFSSGNSYFGLDDFTFLLFLAYIVTLIPALCTGCVYGFLSLTKQKCTLRWVVPMSGCAIYLLYIYIMQAIFAFLDTEGTYLILVFTLLSICGTFFSTIIANISLKGKISV